MQADESGLFTREQLNYVAADMFGAGTETTTTTLRWLLLDLAAAPMFQVTSFTVAIITLST